VSAASIAASVPWAWAWGLALPSGRMRAPVMIAVHIPKFAICRLDLPCWRNCAATLRIWAVGSAIQFAWAVYRLSAHLAQNHFRFGHLSFLRQTVTGCDGRIFDFNNNRP